MVPKWTYKNEIMGLCNTKIPKNHHINSITIHPNKSYFEKIIILLIIEFRRNFEFEVYKMSNKISVIALANLTIEIEPKI